MVKAEQSDPRPSYTLEAIDRIIARGGWAEFVRLAESANSDPSILDAVEQVCLPYMKGLDLFEPHCWFWVAWIDKSHRTPSP